VDLTAGKIPVQYSQQNVFALAKKKKTPGRISIFFLSFNKQKIEHQPESSSGISWTTNLWKGFLNSVTLNPVQEESALRKATCHFSPLASFKTDRLNLQMQWVRNIHHL
jgi:hypothetical protein